MAVKVEAWQVHDTGLVALAGPFRRLPGRVRHHQSPGDVWPDRLLLDLDQDELRVSTDGGPTLGRWPCEQVTARLVTPGPPVSFVLDVPGSSHLLAAPADHLTDALLAALAQPDEPRQ